MSEKNISRMFSGSLFIVLGIILLLKTMGLLNFSIWQAFQAYWPVCLILMGLALMFDAKSIAFFFLILTIVFGSMFFIDSFSVSDFELDTYTKEIEIESEIKNVKLDLDFGVGDIKIRKGDNNVIRTKALAKSENSITLNHEIKDSSMNIDIKKSFHSSGIFQISEESWDVELSPDINYDINLEYGAADLNFDLSSLNVDELDLDCGASSTQITFNKYPTSTKIDAGAASIYLYFYKDYPVKITVNGGALSVDLDGFTKNNENYYTENFNEGEEYISIYIDAGATSIHSEFIEEQ